MSLFKPSVISISAAYEELFKKSPVPTIFGQHVGGSNSVLAVPLHSATMHNHHVSTQARNSKMSIIQQLRDKELDSQTDDSSLDSPDEFCIISPQKPVATRAKGSDAKRLFSHNDGQKYNRGTNRDDFKVPPTFQRPRASTNKFISNEIAVNESQTNLTIIGEVDNGQMPMSDYGEGTDNGQIPMSDYGEGTHQGGIHVHDYSQGTGHDRIPVPDYSIGTGQGQIHVDDTDQESHSLSFTASETLNKHSKHTSEHSPLPIQNFNESMDQDFHSLSSTDNESDGDEYKVTPVARSSVNRKQQSFTVTSSTEVVNLQQHNSVSSKRKSRQKLQTKSVPAKDSGLSDSDRIDKTKNEVESNKRKLRNTRRSSKTAVLITSECSVSETDDGVVKDLESYEDSRSRLRKMATKPMQGSDRAKSNAVSPDSNTHVRVDIGVEERTGPSRQEFDQDKLTCVNEMTATDESAWEEKNSAVGSGMDSVDEDNITVKPIQSTNPSSHRSPSIHCLSSWIIKPHNVLKSIVVDGKRSTDPDGCYWHSSSIVERVGARIVKTCSGTVYKLEGKMDVDYAYDAGFPRKIIMAFKSGFPPNWQKLVDKHFVDSTRSKSRHKKEKNPKKKKPAAKSKPVPKVKAVPKVQAVPINNSLLDTTQSRDMSIPVSNLHQTRTGRVVKPPVLWWCGEQAKLNAVTGTVEIIGCSPYMNTKQIQVPSDPRKSSDRFSGCGASFMETPKSNRSICAAKSVIPSKKASVREKKPKNILPSLTKSAVVSENCAPVNISTVKKQMSSSKPPILSLLESMPLKHVKSSKGIQKSTTNNNSNKENQSSQKPIVSGSGDVCATEIWSASKKHDSITGYDGELDKKQTVNGVKATKSIQKLTRQQRILSRSPCIKLCDRCYQSVSDCRRTRCIDGCQNGNVRQCRKAAVHSRQLSKSLLMSTDTNMRTSTEGEFSSSLSNDDQYIATCDRVKRTKRKATCNSAKTKSSNKISDIEKSRRHTRSKDRITSKKNDAETDAEWSKMEKERFNKAMQKTSSESPMFWSLIAQAVGTRTLEECQQYHYKDVPSDGSKKIKKVQEKKTKEPVVLTGAVGTLKRKRALRQLMDQFNEGCEDDMFDSTPMRTVKTRSRIGGLMADIDDTEMFVLPFDTPKMATPHVGIRVMADPFSAKKTPSLSLPSPAIPDSVDRNKVEQFVHNMQHRGGKKRRMDKMDDQQKVVSKPACSNQRLLSTISEADMWEKEQNSDDKDSDEESDFYWSDDLGD